MVKTKASSSSNRSAVERRILALAPSATTIDEGVRHVVSEIMKGVTCPPTNLVSLGEKLGVRKISYERIPGSGELRKLDDGYHIICSTDQSRRRQRFTVAHELAHIVLEGTGRNAPRAGTKVERVCDRLAAECLMPASVMVRYIPTEISLGAIASLADTFDTSITATAIRCGQLRRINVFGVTADRVTWGYGGVRRGSVAQLLDEVRDNVRVALNGGQSAARVFFYTGNYRGGDHRFEWIRVGGDSAVFLLTRLPTSDLLGS